MATAKKMTKKTVKKATVKKVAATRTIAAKPATPKAAVKKTPAGKTVEKKPAISQERFYAMVSEAAYFAAQNDGNRKGSTEYWLDAEVAVRAKLDNA